MIEVLNPGLLATVQDLGRPGHAHLGVPPSGAVDDQALRLANRLVGNLEATAGIEMTLIGSTLRFHANASIALTGAVVTATCGGQTLSPGTLATIPAGSVLEIGPTHQGARVYLAVRGGIDAPAVLGSRSTDLLTGLGPAPLQRGDWLATGPAQGPWPGVDFAPIPAPGSGPTTLVVVIGPRHDWFHPDALEQLLTGTYVVTPDSNRIGLKLDGPAMTRQTRAELPSEGLVTGALQVPPSEQPILFLNDHPTTGGYPVIGAVTTASLPKAAQLRPGDSVRFCRSHRQFTGPLPRNGQRIAG